MSQTLVRESGYLGRTVGLLRVLPFGVRRHRHTFKSFLYIYKCECTVCGAIVERRQPELHRISKLQAQGVLTGCPRCKGRFPVAKPKRKAKPIAAQQTYQVDLSLDVPAGRDRASLVGALISKADVASLLSRALQHTLECRSQQCLTCDLARAYQRTL